MLNWFRKSTRKRTVVQSFNGIKAIQTHLDQRNRIEDFVNGISQEKPEVPISCYAECMFGKWLINGGVKLCGERDRLDSLCKSCDEFQKEATYAVLLAKFGEIELAKATIQTDQMFNYASERFQTNLAELHVDCLSRV